MLLPTYKGMTVDERQREFRWFDPEYGLQTISFDSVEGALLYAEMQGLITLELSQTPSGLTLYRPRLPEHA